jgi:pilus assembly protein CpaE
MENEGESNLSDIIQVLIVANRDPLLHTVTQFLEHKEAISVLGAVNQISELMNKLEVLTPNVVLMDITDTTSDPICWVEKISANFPKVALVVLADNPSAEEVRRYMRAGAKDYLSHAIPNEELYNSIVSVCESERLRYSRNTVAILEERSTRKSCMVAFISAKGGVGKTTLAVNTGVALARQGKRTALVDLDLQFGDTSLLLNLAPENSIIHLVREVQDIDPEVVERYMIPHDSGMMLLSTGSRPEESEYVTAADVRVILQALRKRFDYIIVDTAPIANDIFFAVLETADERLMVSTLNLAVLKNNRLLMDLLEELDYDLDSVKHVLNRVNSKNGLKVRDVKRVLKSDVYCELDNDFKFVESAANEGTIFVDKNPQHRLSKQIQALTAKLDVKHGGRISRRNPLLRKWTKRSSSI